MEANRDKENAMADQEGPDPRDPRIPGELFRSTAGTPAFDLAEALGGLDRATRDFARRLGEGREDDDPRHLAAEPKPPAASSFAAKMEEAEREAGEYLEHAKRRADSLVSTMVGAVEEEAAEMRRDAEAGIRARWTQVEIDVERHVGEARRIADTMVFERQRRIAELSDGITGRAGALTAGMDDAARVRAQFDSFVRALSKTADQIARGRELGSVRAAPGRRDDQDRPSAIAA